MRERGTAEGFGHTPFPKAVSAPALPKGVWMVTNYVPLRRGLLEHAKSGPGFGLNHEEGWAFVILLIKADASTGLLRGCAKTLLSYNWSYRQAKHIMERLEKKGYIKRFCKPRQRGNYPILIDKYAVTRGPRKGQSTSAKQSTSPQNVFYVRPPDVSKDAPYQEVRKENNNNTRSAPRRDGFDMDGYKKHLKGTKP